MTSGPFLKVIFSGTNISVQKSLYFASDVKVYRKVNQLKPGDDKEVGILLDQFLRMELLSEEERRKACEQLVGPFRITQYFLNAVYQDQDPNSSKVK